LRFNRRRDVRSRRLCVACCTGGERAVGECAVLYRRGARRLLRPRGVPHSREACRLLRCAG